jgi:hypothetical protein
MITQTVPLMVVSAGHFSAGLGLRLGWLVDRAVQWKGSEPHRVSEPGNSSEPWSCLRPGLWFFPRFAPA